MKKTVAFLIAILFLASCAKQDLYEEVTNPVNHYPYAKVLGDHVLWAGRNTNAGNVEYSIVALNGVDNLKVEYQCASGWTISEWHVYAGQKISMVRNKPGSPKIGNFPFKAYPSPWQSVVTLYVPMSQITTPTNPYFVIAAHCVLHGPNGRCETGWAYGNHKFTDKDWGWYDDITYWNGSSINFLVTISTNNGNLNINEVNTAIPKSTLLYTENVGTNSGTYEGVAYIVNEGILLYVNNNPNGVVTLYYNDLNDVTASQVSGTLTTVENPGTVVGATFEDGVYTYVKADGTIHNLTFAAGGWTILTDEVVSTIPLTNYVVNDIALNDIGDKLYILGVDNNTGQVKLISYQESTPNDVFNEISLSGTLPVDAQLVSTSDGEIQAIGASGSGYTLFTLEIVGSSAIVVDEDVIDEEDPLGGLRDAASFINF